VFDDAMLQRCEQIMRDVCTGFGAELREFNGENDHVRARAQARGR
jgi:putative transposase